MEKHPKMESCILQDFQEISTSELPQTKLITLPRAQVLQGLGNQQRNLGGFFFSLENLMDLIILHSPIGNGKEPALSN